MASVLLEVEGELLVIQRDSVVRGKISRNKKVIFRDLLNNEKEGIVRHFGETKQCLAYMRECTDGNNGPRSIRLQMTSLPPRSRGTKREQYSPSPERFRRESSTLSLQSTGTIGEESERMNVRSSLPQKSFVTPKGAPGLTAKRVGEIERRVVTPAVPPQVDLSSRSIQTEEQIRDLTKQIRAMRLELAELKEMTVANQKIMVELRAQQQIILTNMPIKPVNKYSGPKYLDDETLYRLTTSTDVDQAFFTMLMDTLFPHEPERSLPVQDRDRSKVAYAKEVYGSLRSPTDAIARRDWTRYTTRYNEVVKKRRKREEEMNARDNRRIAIANRTLSDDEGEEHDEEEE